MPRIVERVVRKAPETRFRLLGTRGMFASADDVLRRFPRTVRRHVEVVPTFDAGELPRLLADCAMGFFPSYLEGFPFAVLEMLAASLAGRRLRRSRPADDAGSRRPGGRG